MAFKRTRSPLRPSLRRYRQRPPVLYIGSPGKPFVQLGTVTDLRITPSPAAFRKYEVPPDARTPVTVRGRFQFVGPTAGVAHA